MHDLFSTNKYLFKYKYHLIGGILFVSMANIFAIVPAQAVRNSIDLVAETIQLYFLYANTSNQSLIYEVFAKSVLHYGLIIFAMALIRGVFMFLMRQTIVVMSRLIEFDQKNEIYAHYQNLPLSFYRKNNTGDLMARISEDVGKVRMYFGPAILYGLNMITMTIFCISFMFSINVKLTLFTLLPLPILSLTIYYVNTMIEKRSTEIQKSLSVLSVFLQEAFSGIRVIKAFAREQDSYRKFSIESEKFREKNLALLKISSVFTPAVMALVGLSILIVVFVGGIEVINGNITPGNIAEFIMYVTMLTWPFTSLGWISSIMQRAAVSQKRINEFLNTKTDIVSTENLFKTIEGNICFENVSLTYNETGIQALKKINFEVKAGKSIAILGNTGSGKSTLANLIVRLLDPTEGKIYVDDVEIKKYAIAHMRSQIGYVPQDVFLFSDTIKNNIAFGINCTDDNVILEASKNADLHQNIVQFAAGYDTVLGERGITLSGGQKQRLSIARALLKNPKVILLDDSLSAVDTNTENTILNNLQNIMKNKTSIIISHRVSSAKLADKIILLENGEIIEQGSHLELMQLGEKYAELYESQIKTNI